MTHSQTFFLYLYFQNGAVTIVYKQSIIGRGFWQQPMYYPYVVYIYIYHH